MVEKQTQNTNDTNNFIDTREIFKIILRNWHLFGFSLVFFAVAAFAFYKYAPAKYTVGATIKINIEEANNDRDNFGNMEGLRLSPPHKDFENELLVMTSSSLISSVVSNLNLTTTYYVKQKSFKIQETYNASPYFVEFTEDYLQPINVTFDVEILNETEFRLSIKEKEVEIYNPSNFKVIQLVPELTFEEIYRFGELIENDYMSLKIILNSEFDFNTALQYRYQFSNTDLFGMTAKIQEKITVTPASEESTVAYVNLVGASIGKAMDFLNALFDEYLDRSMEKKNFLATSTIDYIEDQLATISDSLLFTERQLQDFRRNYEVLDIADKANRMYQQLDDYETRENTLDRQFSYYRQIQDYFDKNMNSGDLLAPSSMGIDDPILNSLIQELTISHTEKNTLQAQNQEKSPQYITVTSTIDNLKNSISENIRYSLSNTKVQLSEVKSRIRLLNAEISKLPQRQRELLGIERQFNLNEQIYNYLLQKRAEAQIIKVSNLPDSEIIEYPRYMGKAFPNAIITIVIAIFLGLMVPALIIFLRSFFNETVQTKEDVERISPFPVLSEIMHHSITTMKNVVNDFPLSPTTESFRSIRTNLILQSGDRASKVIVITSSTNDEGKSFCSLNLATSFTSLKQPTILVNLDLRKPDPFIENLGTEPLLSIHSFLSDNAKLDDIIMNTDIPNLDYIASTEINTDPVELLASLRFTELIKRLKEIYAYVVIDTPPIGPVGDALVVMQHADINLYVSRANYTNWKFMRKKLAELHERKFDKVQVILNDVKPKWLSGPSTYYTYTTKTKKGFLSKSHKKSKEKSA